MRSKANGTGDIYLRRPMENFGKMISEAQTALLSPPGNGCTRGSGDRRFLGNDLCQVRGGKLTALPYTLEGGGGEERRQNLRA